MIATANSSALIALSSIGQLELLHQRFPEGVLIPRAVWAEVVEAGHGLPGSAGVASSSWITVCDVTDVAIAGLLRLMLDAGEAEAITLCREKRTPVVLLDEREARKVAGWLDLRVLGTVGILMWARREGLVASLQDELDALQGVGRFRLAPAVREQALRTVGELGP